MYPSRVINLAIIIPNILHSLVHFFSPDEYYQKSSNAIFHESFPSLAVVSIFKTNFSLFIKEDACEVKDNRNISLTT